MAIIITPIPAPDHPDSIPVNVTTPEINSAFDTALLGKKRAIVLRQNFKTAIQFQIINNCEGVALDTPPSILYSEASLAIDRRIIDTSTIITAAEGIIEVSPPKSVRNNAGIYFLEAAVLDTDGDPVFSNELYLYVERSAFGKRPIGPPQISDIKLNLRDSDVAENELIANYNFGTVEIAHAATQAVQIWNSSPPSVISLRYSTLNFPHRDVWIQGINSILFSMAVEHFRKNMLPYSAGGVNIEDYGPKLQAYEAAAARKSQEFRESIITLKAQLNINRGFARIG